MEMPELNEDVMEAEEETSAEQTAISIPDEGEGDGEEMQEGDAEQQQQLEEPASIIEPQEDTLDSTDIPKPEEDPSQETLQESESHETAAAAAIEENQEDEEPSPKKPKLEDPDEEDIGESAEVQPAAATPSVILPEPVKVKKDAEEGQPDTDMLSTLASAALKQDEKGENKTIAAEPAVAVVPPVKEDTGSKKKEQWHNVGIFDSNTTTVTDYVASSETLDDVKDVASIMLGGKRIMLEPGTAYKLRVCAINACGTGPWSEVAAFKTTLPGFPGAPSAIKISKSPDGAHLTWEPPGGNSGEILEYAVYLAVRSASQGSQPVATSQSQLAFVRVFCGPTNKCVVATSNLQAAHIDTTTKPAIIFRIAARNAKGYGPATQVRWLQESANAITPGSPAGKRATKV